MLSILMNARLKKTKLIFPDDQKLWAFFSNTEVSEFRIESSKNVMTGKFRQADIELAKQKLGAYELKEETVMFNSRSRISHFRFSFAQ